MSLTLHNVSRSVNGEVHLDDISLSLNAGVFNVLLGRTLSGKTSLLRVLAGLDRPDSGQLTMSGQDLTHLPVQRRNVSMVYQQFINYPHLSVFENIASPLRVARRPDDEIKRRVKETAELLHIENFLQRFPLELSGGQQQRPAMARALVKDASVILFDEPLVNLDYKLREELRTELREWFKASDTIVVYATTEANEAFALEGITTLLHRGRAIQTASAIELYQNPSCVIAAELMSDPSLNILNPKDCASIAGTHEQQVVAVRPEHLRLSADGDSSLEMNMIVDVAEISGSETFLHLHGDSQASQSWDHQGDFVARLRGVHQYNTGDSVTVYISPENLLRFDQETGYDG